jgi:hypothetical protein
MQNVPYIPPVGKPVTVSTSFPVYHASIQGVSGATIELGNVVYFSPVDDDPAIYAMPDTSLLIVKGQIPEPMATFVRAQIAGKLQHNRLVCADMREVA